MQSALRIIALTSRAAAAAAAVIIPLLVLAMVWEVISRYLFNAPTIWAYEISYMLLGATFVLGIAHALVAGYHVQVDFLYARLSDRGKAIVDVIGYCLLLPTVWWLAYYLGEYALSAFRTGEHSGQSAWNPAIWPYRSVLALGFGIFALQATAKFIEAVMLLAGRNLGSR